MADIHRKKSTFNQRYLVAYENYLDSNSIIIIFLPKNSDRTLSSALMTLAGMFPPSGNQIWNKDIHWQPIPGTNNRSEVAKLEF